MPKILFIMITLITFTFPIYTMKIDCWFKGLPIDIIELIGLFLRSNELTETKEEFIERTQYMIDQKPFCTQFNTGETMFSAYCPRRDKYALLRISRNKEKLPYLKEQRPFFSIIETKTDLSLYQENLPDKEYKCIAVCQDGTMFATIHTELEITDNYYDYCTAVPRYTSFLIIKNIHLPNKIKYFDLHHHFNDPFGFTSPAIAFNKQGTLLIVHYHNNNNKLLNQSNITKKNLRPDVNQRKIFRNTTNPYIDRATTLLDKYLAQHMVCKNLTLQLCNK